MTRAIIVTVGDELLIGQVIDTNSAWIGDQLSAMGIEVVQILSIEDSEQAIHNALDSAFANADLILMTGGLGPTKDDITKKALVNYLDDSLYFDEATYNKIQRFFEKLGRKPLKAHKDQCYMPRSSSLLRNNLGTAPGMLFKHQEKILVSMPGVPYEMKSIFDKELKPILLDEFGKGFYLKKTIRTVGRGESQIAELIQHIVDQFSDNFKIAYLPGLMQVRLRISGRGDDLPKLQKELDDIVTKIEKCIPDIIFGYDDETMQDAIGKLLIQKNLKVAFAESCTGGYLTHLITSVPGSSAYLEGSFVTYSYALKESLLGVSSKTLQNHGAVSEETVIEMVEGCLNRTNANVAISISGIAGPGGGTEDKPVGTIWLALSDGNRRITKKLNLQKDRDKNIKLTATHALNLLRKYLIGQA